MANQICLRRGHILTRPTSALIDLDALRKNYQWAKRTHGKKTLAVMKANAYGHGAVPCAQAIQDIADGYAVAFMDEAIELREHGIHKPIVLLEGVFDEREMREVSMRHLSVVVHHSEQIKLLRHLQLEQRKSSKQQRIDVWLKVDTGMHRLGFHPDEVMETYQQLRSNPLVGVITLMTHFSRADECDASFTQEQIRCFDLATKDIAASSSLCNSAGLSVWSVARKDWGRAGLIIYGVEPGNGMLASNWSIPVATPYSNIPCHDNSPVPPSLCPVMTLKSKVMAVRSLPAGEPIGYGASFVTHRPTRLGVVAIGYGDGYPRHAPSGTPVLVDKQPTQLIGRVCMDMLMVDLTDLPDTGFGSEVELWGKSLDVNLIAKHAGTVSYALLTGVMRINRIYSDTIRVKTDPSKSELSLAT